MRAVPARWLAAALAVLAVVYAPARAALDGAGIVERALAHRSEACCIYQELTMILSDAAGERAERGGERTERGVRRIRWYERRASDGGRRILLVFVAPTEVRGAALLLRREALGATEGEIYLPALGQPLGVVAGTTGGMRLVGSDFRISDLLGEAPRGFAYAREADAEIDRSMHFVVRATPSDAAAQRAGGGPRRYYVRKGDFFLVRIDFHDLRGRLVRRQSFRDPKQVAPDTWQADMVLMEDFAERHRSLIKVERRVFSPDYVPPDIFSRQWLLEQRYLLVGGDAPFGP